MYMEYVYGICINNFVLLTLTLIPTLSLTQCKPALTNYYLLLTEHKNLLLFANIDLL